MDSPCSFHLLPQCLHRGTTPSGALPSASFAWKLQGTSLGDSLCCHGCRVPGRRRRGRPHGLGVSQHGTALCSVLPTCVSLLPWGWDGCSAPGAWLAPLVCPATSLEPCYPMSPERCVRFCWIRDVCLCGAPCPGQSLVGELGVCRMNGCVFVSSSRSSSRNKESAHRVATAAAEACAKCRETWLRVVGLLGIVEVGHCPGRAVATHGHAGQLKVSGNTVTDFLMWYLPVFPFANQNWYTPDFLKPATGCVTVVALWRVARLPFLHLWPCPATVHGLGWGFCAMSPDPSCWPAGSCQCVWWLWPTSLLTPDGNVVTVSGVTRSE